MAGTKSVVHYLKPLGYRVALLGKSHVGPNECYPFERLGGVSKKVDANPETLTKARAFLDDCKKSDNPFASSSVPMIPRTLHHGRYLRLRCRN